MAGLLDVREPIGRMNGSPRPQPPKRPPLRHRTTLAGERRDEADSAPPQPAAPPRLTPRQLECLQWVARGKSSSDIGIILNISPLTVDEHIGDACRRLQVRTRIQAILDVYKRGLLD